MAGWDGWESQLITPIDFDQVDYQVTLRIMDFFRGDH